MQVVAHRGRWTTSEGNVRSQVAQGPDRDPAARARSGRYMPALDGLRAVAVGAVIAYHLGYGWAGGGYLGVDLFFVLSGFLITGLLVDERLESGSMQVGSFWVRRAKRLLPGLLLMLLALSAWVALAGPQAGLSLGQLRGDALASIFYVANWHLLFAHQPYFAQFATPSPLEHTWSLAIEEQFYLIWPLVLVVFLGRGFASASRGSRTLRLRALGVLCLVAACASAAWMSWLASHGASVDRMYYGTDTRAFDLLAGAALAMAVAARSQAAGPQTSTARRRTLHAGGLLGAGVVGICFWRAASSLQSPPRWMFEGGFLLCVVGAALVIADVHRDRTSPLGAVLKLRPVRWVGKISYGLYLWHWPVIVELTSRSTGVSGLALTALRVGVTFGAATASFYLVEQPIRRAKFSGWPRALRVALAPSAMVATAVVAVAATVPAAASSASPSVRLTSLSAVPGAGGISKQEPIRLPPASTPTKEHPLRVMLLGDSVMYVEAPAVAAALGSSGVVDVVDHAFPGWGLTTDHNWPHDVLGAVDEVHPQLVIAMWSWDNSLALAHPVAYERELEQFVRVLLTPGDGVDGVVFEQFPVEGPVIGAVNPAQETEQTDARSTGVSKWNSLVSLLPGHFPGRVMYFPVGAAVELDGHFATWLPPGRNTRAPRRDWVRVRMIDDVHLCPAGAARYADALLADMTSAFHLPAAAPSWSTGSWTKDPRYLEADGFSAPPCPDDHPGS